MHAVVINVTINDRAGAQAELKEVVPMVSGAPGFVAAYWVALTDNTGTSVAMFDTEASAEANAAMVRSAPREGAVTMDSVTVGEVLAHA